MVAPSRSSKRQQANASTIRQAFGKVSKPSSTLQNKKELKLQESLPDAAVNATAEKKRKRDRLSDELEDSEDAKKVLDLFSISIGYG